MSERPGRSMRWFLRVWMRAAGRAVRDRDGLGRGILVLLVVGLPLGVGGAHPEVAAATTALLVATTLLWARANDRSFVVTLPVVGAGFAFAATLLQLIPLPLGVIGIVSPATHDLLVNTRGAVGGFAPLSLDVPATAHEALKLLALLLAAILVATVVRQREHRRSLLVWLVVAGGLVVSLGSAQFLLGITRPYGAFGRTRGVFTSSFVNPNHLAGFLGFAAFCGLAASTMFRDRRRWLTAAGAGICVGGVFLSMSRGGMVAWLVAAAGLGVWVVLRPVRRAHGLVAVAAAALSIGGVCAYAAYGDLVAEFWELGGAEPVAKLAVWEPLPRIVAAFALTGVGRGAFGAVYPRFKSWDANLSFSHVENEVLQALADWGVVAGSAIVLFFALCFVAAMRRAHGSAYRASALAGLAFLGLHNLVDFNLTLLSVAVPAILVLVAMTTSRSGQAAEGGRFARLLSWNVRPSPRMIFIATLFAAGGGVWLAEKAVVHSLERDTEHLRTAFKSGKVAADWTMQVANQAIERHPADFMLPLVVAQSVLERDRDPGRALRWINQGMYLAPGFPGGHQLAGRALLQVGAQRQALAEYRQACLLEPRSARSIATDLRTHGDVSLVERLAGAVDAECRSRMVGFLYRIREFEAATRVVNAAKDPSASEWALVARAHIRTGSYDNAVGAARAMARIEPESAEAYDLQAEALAAARRYSEASAAIDEGLSRARDKERLLARGVLILIERGQYRRALDMVDQLLAMATDGRAVSRAHFLAGKTHAREGRLALALRAYRRARESAPENLAVRLEMASVRERVGDLDGAAAELELALSALGSNPQIDAALARIRRKQSTAGPR